MPKYVPMLRPYPGHTKYDYWAGVTDLHHHSNFEQPKVSVRTGPAATTATPPAWQPPIAASGFVDTGALEQPWRADRQP